MTEPITELDERFSEPRATAHSWADTQKILATAELSWISTVRRDGRPHVTPLVAVWDQGSLYFTSGPDEQKSVNLKDNDAVAVTTGSDDWDRGADVVVEGRATRVTNPEVLQRLARKWEEKWDGRWQFEAGDEAFEYPGGKSLVYEVTPVRILVFGRGTFSHTRHLFDRHKP